MSIGPNSGQQREKSQVKRSVIVCIGLCFHLYLLKSILLSLLIFTTRSTALTHVIPSSGPLHHPHHLLNSKRLCHVIHKQTTTISSQFSAPHTQELKPTTSTDKTPLFSFCRLTEAEVSKLQPTAWPPDPIPSHLLQAISH